MKKTFLEIYDKLIENDLPHFHSAIDYRRFASEAMKEYAIQFPNQEKWVSLNDKVFDLANELAVAGFGEQAVKMHEIHNSLPSPLKPNIGIHLIAEPSPTTDLLLAKLEMQGKTAVVVNPKDKEQMRQIAFEQPSIPYANPYKDIINLRTECLVEPIRGSNIQKKFRKQNNRKHKKSRK